MTPAGEFASIREAEVAYRRRLPYYFKTRTDEFYYLNEVGGALVIPPKRKVSQAPALRKKGKFSWVVNFPDTCAAILPDPRLEISRHISWTSSTGGTTWSQPEPDNYNRAVFDTRAHHIPGIENQCWYQDITTTNWFSVYYCKSQTEMDIWQNYTKINQPQATWAYSAVPLRNRISKIDLEGGRQFGKNKSATADERLMDMGYYEQLIMRGADPDFIAQHVGVRRPEVADTRTAVLEYTEEE
jgi:hypothetical protein